MRKFLSLSAKSFGLALCLSTIMDHPAVAEDVRNQSTPMPMTSENMHDWACHLYLYEAYSSLAEQGEAQSEAGIAAYSVNSYFLGKVTGRNGSNFSVTAEMTATIRASYPGRQERDVLLRSCLDEFNAALAKIE